MMKWIKSVFGGRGTNVELGVPAAPLDEGSVMRAALHSLLMDRKAERRSRTLRAVLYFLMFALPACLYVGFYAWSAGFRFEPSGDVVAVVRLEGEMADGAVASADRVIPSLRKAFEAERVKGVILSIDSPGGAPLEAERIYTALEELRRTHPKPVVSVINNLGASAAYMVAIHTERLYAGNYSLVGSVGAILSGWDAHEALARVGVTQRVYASGELKAMMNPWVPMSPEADRKARQLVNEMGEAFRAEVLSQRKDKLKTGIDFASGGVWGGAEAARIGLVDEVATIYQVLKARWPGLKAQELGPRSGGLPCAQATADWVADVVATSASRMRVEVTLR